jgi:hypothetical protein
VEYNYTAIDGHEIHMHPDDIRAAAQPLLDDLDAYVDDIDEKALIWGAAAIPAHPRVAPYIGAIAVGLALGAYIVKHTEPDNILEKTQEIFAPYKNYNKKSGTVFVETIERKEEEETFYLPPWGWG